MPRAGSGTGAKRKPRNAVSPGATANTTPRNGWNMSKHHCRRFGAAGEFDNVVTKLMPSTWRLALPSLLMVRMPSSRTVENGTPPKFRFPPRRMIRVAAGAGAGVGVGSDGDDFFVH